MGYKKQYVAYLYRFWVHIILLVYFALFESVFTLTTSSMFVRPVETIIYDTKYSYSLSFLDNQGLKVQRTFSHLGCDKAAINARLIPHAADTSIKLRALLEFVNSDRWNLPHSHSRRRPRLLFELWFQKRTSFATQSFHAILALVPRGVESAYVAELSWHWSGNHGAQCRRGFMEFASPLKWDDWDVTALSIQSV